MKPLEWTEPNGTRWRIGATKGGWTKLLRYMPSQRLFREVAQVGARAAGAIRNAISKGATE